jgi:hypothetical protein
MEGVFTRFKFSRGKLPDKFVERIPVLLYHQDGTIGEQCKGGCSSRMFGNFPDPFRSGRIFDIINDSVKYLPIVDLSSL